MARTQFLINRHTSKKTDMPNDLRLGEIAVRHNEKAPELLILKDDGEYATFVDKVYIETLVTTLDGNIEAVAGNVTTLSAATVAGFNDRYTKKEVNDHLANAVASGATAAADALADAKEYSDGKLSAATEALETQIETVAGNVTTLSAATVAGFNDRYTKKEVNDHLANAIASGATAAANAFASAKTYTDSEVASAKTELSAQIEEVAGNVSDLEEKVETIIGVDSGMTTRQIVVDELAKQLLSDKADADFKTLKELADWLENHPEDVASINSDITALSAATGSLSTNIETVAGKVTSLSAATVDGFAERYTKDEVDTEVANAIASGETAAANALASAKTYTDSEVASAKTALSKDIETVAGKVTTLSAATVAGFNDRYTKKEVNDHLANAVASGATAAANALASAKTYTDSEVASAKTALSKDIETVAGKVTTLSAATVELAGKAVTSIEITGTEDPDNTEKQTVTAKIESNVAKFDFSNMIIDCGEF